MYCLNLLEIALVLAEHDPVYEDMATKFFEHFAYIADGHAERACGTRRTASTTTCSTSGDGEPVPLRVRSVVGLLPLCATTHARAGHPRAPARLRAPPALVHGQQAASSPRARPARHERRRHRGPPAVGRPPERLARILAAHARRATSSCRRTACGRCRPSTAPAVHRRPRRPDGTGRLRAGRVDHRPVRRQLELAGTGVVPGQPPAHRGAAPLRPVLRRRTIGRVPDRLRHQAHPGAGGRRAGRPPRRPFLDDADGDRPAFGDARSTATGWHDRLLFNEYFHGDTGAGLGASHQTGWTGLVADLDPAQVRGRRPGHEATSRSTASRSWR